MCTVSFQNFPAINHTHRLRQNIRREKLETIYLYLASRYYTMLGPVEKMSAVRAYSTSNNTIHVEWTLNPNPLVEGYFVELTKRSQGLTRNVTLNSFSSFVDFTSLETLSNYSVQVASFTWCHYGVKSDPLFASTGKTTSYFSNHYTFKNVNILKNFTR